MHFLSKHCCCHALMSKSCVLPWSQCSSLVWTAHGRTRLLVWKPFFLVCTYNTDYIPFHVAHSMSTVFICTSPGLQINCTTFYKEFCTYYVHQWFPTPVVNPRNVIFKSTRSIPDTNQSLPGLRDQHLGFWEWRTTNIHTHTQLDVSPFYPHFKCDRIIESVYCF